MRRIHAWLAAACALVVLATAAPAQAQQSINVFVGGFTPRSEGTRTTSDVIYQNGGFLAFDMRDFDGATAGIEWLTAVSDNFDAGFGVGIYSRGVPSVYAGLVNANRSEIKQQMDLRIAPFTATFRWLPLGHHDAIEPYIGAGVAVYSWRYSEQGQFVDPKDNSLFSGTYRGSGTATGPVVLAGLRVPVGSVGVGGEVRYQAGEGVLPTDQGFAGSKIDLGGVSYLLSFNVRF
mgnify:CR=1 FL=1